ncbi:phage holin family protein [Sphingomonas sp. NBWT7]|nr:phage holin family protein [Sphingomonas sp. NBWT7]
MAQAEIGLVKARATASVTRYRSAATFFGIAAVLGLAGLIALLVGLILSLATLIGPGLATLAVVGAVFLVAGILALIGKSRLAQGTAA